MGGWVGGWVRYLYELSGSVHLGVELELVCEHGGDLVLGVPVLVGGWVGGWLNGLWEGGGGAGSSNELLQAEGLGWVGGWEEEGLNELL